MSREAMKLALDAFDCFFPTEDGQLWYAQTSIKQIDTARQALRQALQEEERRTKSYDEWRDREGDRA